MGYFGRKNGKCLIKYKVSFQGVYSIVENEIISINKDSEGVTGGYKRKFIKVYPKSVRSVIKPH